MQKSNPSCKLLSFKFSYSILKYCYRTSDVKEKAAVLQGKGRIIASFSVHTIILNVPHSLEHISYFGTLNTLPLFFGQAVYSFEGIGMVRKTNFQLKIRLQSCMCYVMH